MFIYSAGGTDVMKERYDDPKSYLDFHYPLSVLEENAPMLTGSVISQKTPQYFHNFYQKYHREWDNSTAVLLEVGGGSFYLPLCQCCPICGQDIPC